MVSSRSRWSVTNCRFSWTVRGFAARPFLKTHSPGRLCPASAPAGGSVPPRQLLACHYRPGQIDHTVSSSRKEDRRKSRDVCRSGPGCWLRSGVPQWPGVWIRDWRTSVFSWQDPFCPFPGPGILSATLTHLSSSRGSVQLYILNPYGYNIHIILKIGRKLPPKSLFLCKYRPF